MQIMVSNEACGKRGRNSRSAKLVWCHRWLANYTERKTKVKLTNIIVKLTIEVVTPNITYYYIISLFKSPSIK